jgi:hypothetical protein
MNTPDLEIVKEVASKVRAGVEKFAKKNNEKVCGDTQNLMCYCAISSAALVAALKKKGIKARLIVGFFDEEGEWDYNDDGTEQLDANHCWVEIAFHYVDITATQFAQYEKDKVLIIENDDTELYYPYESPKSLRSMRGSNKKAWGRQAPRVEYTKQILKLAGV